MKKLNELLDLLKDRLFSSTYQLQRIVTLTGIALVLAVVSFGSYYYYDRYYSSQPTVSELSVGNAEKAVHADPQSVEARIALAEAYMLNRRFEEAVTQANEILIAEPQNQRALLVIGVSYANTGKPADAVGPLTKYMNSHKDEELPGLDKQLQAAVYYLGDSYLQLGKPQEAIAPLEMAVNWAQTDADSMYKLGMAYLGAQQYEKAINMFHGATTFVPDFLEAYEAMAASYDATNQPALAVFARGMAAYSKKDYTTARDLLLESIQGKADFAPTYAGLGRVYESLNDLPNAKASYEAALKLDINNFTASNGIQRVDALLNK